MSFYWLSLFAFGQFISQKIVTNQLFGWFDESTRTLFCSNIPVMRCKAARLVKSWVSNENQLIGIDTQRLFSAVICWLTSRHERTINYNTAQTLVPFLQGFMSLKVWSIKSLWTMNTQSCSAHQVFQSVSQKCKIPFLQWCPKKIILFLCECIINLLKETLRAWKDITWQIFTAKFNFCL